MCKQVGKYGQLPSPYRKSSRSPGVPCTPQRLKSAITNIFKELKEAMSNQF